MSRRYFGTDGVRGAVGAAPMTADFALRLGHAVGRHLVAEHAASGAAPRRLTVLIGKDTRASGYMLEAALEAGFNSAGVNVRLTGPVPTPAVAYLARALRLDLGVVISASHNPFGDNGFKFFSASGQKLPDAWEHAVETLVDAPPAYVQGAQVGRTRRIDDAAGRYIEFCKATVGDLSLRGLKVVVDAAHGAAYQVAPDVFHELGAHVVTMGCAPDGVNINDAVGATAPQALVAAVQAQGADYGIALDGDADRVLLVDSAGRLYDGDEMLYVLAADRLAAGRALPGVVGTLMTNLGVEQALAARGVPLVRAKVGDRYVLEALLERGWQLGGEGSGHLLVLDRHTTGDGIVSGLQVLQAVQRQGRSLAQLLAGVERFPQVLLGVRLRQREGWEHNPALRDARAAVEAELGASGRVLIRPSGTEPLLRVMVECDNAEQARRCADRLVAAAQG